MDTLDGNLWNDLKHFYRYRNRKEKEKKINDEFDTIVLLKNNHCVNCIIN